MPSGCQGGTDVVRYGIDTKERFAVRLRQIRTRQGLSQDRLAERSGLSTDGISNLERGINTPGLDTVWILRTALDVPIWELLDFMEQGEAPDPERRTLEDALLTAAHQLDIGLLEVAVAQLEALTRYRQRPE